MPRTYLDDFTKLPITKMAQAITDMTYAYEETQVPKEHYKKCLNKQYEEMVETTVSVKLVETIYNGLSGLQKESPRLFFQALLLLDQGIKPSALTAQQFQAMTVVADSYEQSKQKLLADNLHQLFDETLLHGAKYRMTKEQADEN